MNYSKHPSALVESGQIGTKTRIGAFTHILADACLGEECEIGDHVFIENDVVIGARTTIQSGAKLWDGLAIEENVFIGPNVTFTNDPLPRSKQRPERFARTLVKKGASIGANATILPGVQIGTYAMVGAGSVVTRNVPAYAIVHGNPARIMGYDIARQRASARADETSQGIVQATSVDGVVLHELPVVRDLRGDLTVAEYGKDLPFLPKRYFLIYGVSSREVRGEHAHRTLHQFLVCTNGSVTVMADDGENRAVFLLNRPNLGLYIPPRIWAAQYGYTDDAVLLVLASEIYKPEDYIRDYDEFLREIGR